MMTERQPMKVDWESIAAERAKMEELASCNLVPRMQQLDGMLSMLVHLYNTDEYRVMGYTPIDLIKVTLDLVHEVTRDCLKITYEMVGKDAAVTPLGDS